MNNAEVSKKQNRYKVSAKRRTESNRAHHLIQNKLES